MHLNNKSGWQTSFTVARSVIEAKTGLKKDAYYIARNQLKQSGLIDFKERGTKATIFTIISFLSEKQTRNEITNATTKPTIPQITSPTFNKLNKTKEKEEDNTARVNPFKFYEQEGFGLLSGFTSDRIGSLIDDYGEEKLLEAMGTAVLYGAKNLKYVEMVLRNPNQNEGEVSGKKVYQYRRGHGGSSSKSAEQALREAEESRKAWGG